MMVQESTRMQLAMREWWKRGQHPEWTAWNQALAVLWLVGTNEMISEAKRMDRIFWISSNRIKAGQMSEDAWGPDRAEMEAARLSFINAARPAIAARSVALNEIPVARPALSEIRDLLGSTQPQGSKAVPAAD
jgi:hypothetical protein